MFLRFCERNQGFSDKGGKFLFYRLVTKYIRNNSDMKLLELTLGVSSSLLFRLEQNPSEAEKYSHLSSGLHPRFSAKGDKFG